MGQQKNYCWALQAGLGSDSESDSVPIGQYRSIQIHLFSTALIGDLPENNKASACCKVLFYAAVSQSLIVPGNSCKLSINHPLRESMMYCSHVAIPAHSTAKVTFKVIIAKPSWRPQISKRVPFWMHAK